MSCQVRSHAQEVSGVELVRLRTWRGEDASTESFGFHDQLCLHVDPQLTQRSLLSSMMNTILGEHVRARHEGCPGRVYRCADGGVES
jgi:hypothetical protein